MNIDETGVATLNFWDNGRLQCTVLLKAPTDEQIRDAAINADYYSEHPETAFEMGARWALEQIKIELKP